jgi:type 1 glutamine amidotransferase
MKRYSVVGLILASTCLFSPPTEAQKAAPGGAKVYLLSGGRRNHHGYRDQAFYLANVLENTNRFEVTIGEDAAILETPAIRKYDLIIVNADRRDPEFKFTQSQQEALFELVRSGRGYVSIHGADNAAQDWLPTWKEMLGGVFSHFGLPDGKTRKGRFTVKIVDTSSPITQGITDFPIEDELYYQLQMMPDVRPLATIEYQGTTWPVAWTRRFGKGRVFHTTMGHRDFGPNKKDPLQDPSLSRLVVQAVEWVAAGRPDAPKP